MPDWLLTASLNGTQRSFASCILLAHARAVMEHLLALSCSSSAELRKLTTRGSPWQWTRVTYNLCTLPM